MSTLPANQPPLRNQSMEIAKMVTAILFLFAHVDEAEFLSDLAAKLSSFGLPMFFAISGYFAFGATSSKLRKRLGHILRLYLIAYLIHLVSCAILVELDGGSTIAYLRAAVPDLDELILLATVQHDSFLGQMWTMATTAICYMLLWAYTRFQYDRDIHYQPLYLVSLILYCGFIAMDTILPATGTEFHYLAYRNAWFLGIPSFSLGIFLHQYQARILECFSLTPGKIAAVTAASFFLVMLGFHILIPLEVVSLMLLIIAVPRFPEGSLIGKLANRCGIWSTAIYILHISVKGMYASLLQDAVVSRVGDLESWLQPGIILLLSFAGALVWEQVDHLVKSRNKRAPSSL